MNRQEWLDHVKVDHTDPAKRRSARAYHRRNNEDLCTACLVVKASMIARSRHGQRKPIPHGTHRGYVAHRRRSEAACTECKEAHNAYTKDRYTRKRT